MNNICVDIQSIHVLVANVLMVIVTVCVVLFPHVNFRGFSFPEDCATSMRGLRQVLQVPKKICHTPQGALRR